jgi:Ca-activated chloride channel family protein
MHRISLIPIFILISVFASAQMTFNTLKHNFGELQSYDNRFIDIVITNHGPKDGYILSVRKPSEIVYIQNRALVQKDSTLTLRFQVNPQQKGKFTYTIDIFTSDKADAHKLILSGTMLELETDNRSSFTSCPDFNTHPVGRKPNQFDLTVIIIDADTHQELEKSKVSMIQDGFALWTDYTDKTGRIKKQGTIGLSYFYAKHEGYLPAEKGALVNNDRNRVIIELKKNPASTITIPEPIIVQQSPEPEIELEVEEQVPPISVLPPVSHPETITSFEQLDEDNFDNSFFTPVNVVFVLDVSSSMNQGDKMELMKYSLNQLSEMIRQQDNISLVTYASKAKILLPPTTGKNKDAIREQIKGLKASGMTAGGEGIKMGFEQAEKGFISGGVNHVFVITDGAFNHNNFDYKKLIRKYAKKNISLSVVGVLNDVKSETSMREIAQLGKGEYIPVFKLLDAQKNIRQAVRKMAFKSGK